MHCEPSFAWESNEAPVFAGKVMHCESQSLGLAGGWEIRNVASVGCFLMRN